MHCSLTLNKRVHPLSANNASNIFDLLYFRKLLTPCFRQFRLFHKKSRDPIVKMFNCMLKKMVFEDKWSISLEKFVQDKNFGKESNSENSFYIVMLHHMC